LLDLFARYGRKNYKCRTLLFPSRLREGLGWAVSAFAKDFAPKEHQGRNIIKDVKIRRGGFFPFYKAPSADGAG
jgi:hypothetical protein